MTRFWREGHWRIGVYGTRHWVEGHWVDQSSGYGGFSRLISAASGDFGREMQLQDNFDPNARCPKCGKPVFFYRNDNGSRVYFDGLGPQWPKHPCMDQDSGEGESSLPRQGARNANALILASQVPPGGAALSGVFIVSRVEKEGKKRKVTIQEVGGPTIDILISPVAPPVGSLAVTMTHEIHWLEVWTGRRGSNSIWWRSDRR